MARLTLDIPDETHRRLKVLAAGSSMSMHDFLIARALSFDPGRPGRFPEEDAGVAGALPPVNHAFRLPPENWELFCAALDAPADPGPELRKLMSSPGVLDEQ